jgi:hypothetical protein
MSLMTRLDLGQPQVVVRKASQMGGVLSGILIDAVVMVSMSRAGVGFLPLVMVTVTSRVGIGCVLMMVAPGGLLRILGMMVMVPRRRRGGLILMVTVMLGAAGSVVLLGSLGVMVMPRAVGEGAGRKTEYPVA